jgi:hypothetical protein
MKTIILNGLVIILLILQISCKTDNDNIVTDVDGNHYHTVIIGTQTWMVENLKLQNIVMEI